MKQLLIDFAKCLGCKSCEVSCSVSHSVTKNLFTAISEEHKPRKRVFVEQGNNLSFPVQCRHCDEPKCAQACMAGAISKDKESGFTLHNAERCVGCWMCVMVCPFGAISQDKPKNEIVKCDRCSETGEPQCATACPTGAIKHLPVDEFSRKKRISYLTNIVFSGEGE